MRDLLRAETSKTTTINSPLYLSLPRMLVTTSVTPSRMISPLPPRQTPPSPFPSLLQTSSQTIPAFPPAHLNHGELRRVRLDDAHDDAEDSKGRRENLHDKDLHEQLRVLAVGQGTCAACHADGDTARQVGQPNRNSRGEKSISREVRRRPLIAIWVIRGILYCCFVVGCKRGRGRWAFAQRCYIDIV